MLPGGSPKKSKFIYITRSPLDACVSFYHHLSHQREGCYEKSFNEFFDEWVEGKIPFGTWSDHILSYASLVANGEAYLLSYEDMVNNLEESVHRLVKFLELDDFITSEDVKNILPLFSFNAMKKDLNKFQPKSVTWKKDFKFLRKGAVGDEKEALNDEQRCQFKMHLVQKEFFDKIMTQFTNVEDGVEYIKNVRQFMPSG